MSTRIVFNGRFLTQPVTGVQRYARETLRALDALLACPDPWRAGWRFELAVPRRAAPFALEHIRTVELPRHHGHLWEQTSLAQYARGSFLVGFSYSGPLLQRRQMITVHDATVVAVPGCFSARYRWFHNTLLAALQSRVDTVMTVSEFSRGEIASRLGVRGRIVVGREGWEHSVAQGDAQAVLDRYGLQSGRYLLSVGSLKPNKNIAVLGAALASLPDFPWEVAVAGAKDPRIFQEAGELPPSIRLLGFVDDADLGLLYRHAAWFVFPSIYEGFGLPAIEAMANGCPVLAANAASLPEVCGGAALYFDPHDSQSLADLLLRVTTDPALRAQALAHQPERLARYTWRANAEILLEELRHQLSGQAA